MNLVPVGKYIQILSLYLAQPSQKQFGRNEIVSKTGSDKPGILKRIIVLEKEGILKTVRKERHTQRKPVELTPLGNEIVSLMRNIKNIEKIEEKMTEKLKEFDYILDKKRTINGDINVGDYWSEIKKKLINEGYKEDWIVNLNLEHYLWTSKDDLGTLRYIFYYMHSYTEKVFNALVYRYFSIIKKYNLRTIAREIIFYIIMEGIDKQVTKKDKWKKNDEYLRLSDILEYRTPKNDINFSTLFYEVVACSDSYILEELPIDVSFEIMKILNPTKEEIYRLIGDPNRDKKAVAEDEYTSATAFLSLLGSPINLYISSLVGFSIFIISKDTSIGNSSNT